MKKYKNIPKLRFSDEWEEYKIGELFNVTRGYVLATNLISEVKNSKNKYPVYSSQTQNEGLLMYYHDFLYENAIT